MVYKTRSFRESLGYHRGVVEVFDFLGCYATSVAGLL
jgi:hypothetical protein